MDLEIKQGKTFAQVLRWEGPPIVWKPITGITKTAPVRITAAGHGLPDGWRACVTSVKGMTQINAANDPPRDKDYHIVTVVDGNTVEFNDVDASNFKTYVSGGYLRFNTPVDLTGYTARMTIKDKVGGTELLSLTTINGRIQLDTVGKTIALNISADDTAAITWKKAVYDLEMVSGSGVVTALASGSIAVTKEVTT